jgi:hypothetical protein
MAEQPGLGDMLLRLGRSIAHITEAMLELRAGSLRFTEVTAVSVAMVAYVDEKGVRVRTVEELHRWALETNRTDLASLLASPPPHVTDLFPERTHHDRHRQLPRGRRANDERSSD